MGRPAMLAGLYVSVEAAPKVSTAVITHEPKDGNRSAPLLWHTSRLLIRDSYVNYQLFFISYDTY